MPRRQRTRLTSPEALEAILQRAGENRFARIRPPIATKLWIDAVGARIAERARPVSLWGGVLVLLVPSSVWAHELSLLAEQVRDRLRERGIDVRELRFRVGAVPNVERPPERRVACAVPPTRAVSHELTRALTQVADPELRSVIAAAAASNLAWQSVSRPGPPTPISEAQRAARAPRSAEAGTSLQDRTSPVSRAAESGTPANAPRRLR